MRSRHTATKSSPRSPQLEEARAQQGLNAAKKKKKKRKTEKNVIVKKGLHLLEIQLDEENMAKC